VHPRLNAEWSRGDVDVSEDEQLTKILVDLPNHWATGGESMWAKDLGGDLYEIRNVPFHAYGLNFADVVRAVSSSPKKKPLVREVARPSGHRTLRVFFSESVPADARLELLRSLNELRGSFEGASPKYFAIDVEPEGDYDAIRARLEGWEAGGVLGYETCEPRVQGSFDDLPEEQG
jgi:uncharacterized protein DUF4265